MRFLLDKERTDERRRPKADRIPAGARVIEAEVELAPRMQEAFKKAKAAEIQAYSGEIRSWLVGLLRKRWPGTNWIRVE
jgi:hypothetical protein